MRFFLYIFCFITSSAIAQSISFSGGKSFNNLFSDVPFELESRAFHTGEGQSFQINIQPTSAKQSLSIILDHYKAEVYPYAYSNAPHVISIDKTTLGLGLYPYDLRVIGNLFIQPGADISLLISNKTRYGSEKASGINGEYIIAYCSDTLKIVNNFQFGIAAVVRYQFNVGNYFLSPSYKIYIGGRSEFSENAELIYYDREVYSLRQTFSIGIGWKFRKREERN